MPRTTVNLDASVLQELRRMKQKEGISLGRLISKLLAEALSRRKERRPVASPRFAWGTRRMDARVDLTDKEAVRAALDRRG